MIWKSIEKQVGELLIGDCWNKMAGYFRPGTIKYLNNSETSRQEMRHSHVKKREQHLTRRERLLQQLPR